MADVTLLQIIDSPVLPRSLTVPSRHLKVRVAGGAETRPLYYRFVKGGQPTKVVDEADRKMLLGLTRRVTGPGGKGLADVTVIELVSAAQQVGRLTAEQKLDRVLELLERQHGKSLEEMLLEVDEAPEEIVEEEELGEADIEPAPVEEEEDIDL